MERELNNIKLPNIVYQLSNAPIKEIAQRLREHNREEQILPKMEDKNRICEILQKY